MMMMVMMMTLLYQSPTSTLVMEYTYATAQLERVKFRDRVVSRVIEIGGDKRLL